MTTLVLIATTEANAKRIMETARKDDTAVSAVIDGATLDYPESARGHGSTLGGQLWMARQEKDNAQKATTRHGTNP